MFSRWGNTYNSGYVFPTWGRHILRICVCQVGEHVSLGIGVSQVGEHVSQGICVSYH